MYLSRSLRGRGYYYKKLHDPNKFKNKFDRRRGFDYEGNITHNTEHLKWAANTQADQDMASNLFPYKYGFDSQNGPVRHRDHRSNYNDLSPETVINWYENPKGRGKQALLQNGMQKNLDIFYKNNYAKVGPRSPPNQFPFKLGDIVEITKGRNKGERGEVTYIREEQNYVLVKGCNIDYSEYHRREFGVNNCIERAVLSTEQIKLVSPDFLNFFASERAKLDAEGEDRQISMAEELQMMEHPFQTFDEIVFRLEADYDEVEGSLIEPTLKRIGVFHTKSTIGQEDEAASIFDDVDGDDEFEFKSKNELDSDLESAMDHFKDKIKDITDDGIVKKIYVDLTVEDLQMLADTPVNDGSNFVGPTKDYKIGKFDISDAELLEEIKQGQGDSADGSNPLLTYEERLKAHHEIEHEEGKKTFRY